jgi:RNA polymerase sigma-70 factor (sigma-E family)
MKADLWRSRPIIGSSVRHRMILARSRRLMAWVCFICEFSRGGPAADFQFVAAEPQPNRVPDHSWCCWEAGLRDEQEYVDYVQARTQSLRRLAHRLCGEWSAADDLVQECLVALYRHWRNASAADSIDAYVRAMLVHAYLAERKRSWTRWVRPAADVIGPPATPLIGAEHRLDLLAALAKLSRGQRAVLVLRYWEDLDVAQTALALGCSIGTVKSQTSYAIAALRRLLPNYVLGGSDTA